MATAVSTISAVNRAPLSLNGSGAGAAVPSSSFMGTSLKKVTPRFNKVASGSFKVVAAKDVDDSKNKDKWAGLAYDISDDQQDITRGKGMVDSLFQAPMGDGTHHAIMSSYDYVSQGLRQFDMDNMLDGFYIAPPTMPPSTGGAPPPTTTMAPPPASTPIASPPMIPTTPTPSMAPSPSSTPVAPTPSMAPSPSSTPMAPTPSTSSPLSPMPMAPSPLIASPPGPPGTSVDTAPSMPPVLSSPSFAASTYEYSMPLLVLFGTVALFI